MHTINMWGAESNLSRLVDAVEQGRGLEIIITRHGRPAAKLVSIEVVATCKHIGEQMKFLTCRMIWMPGNDEVAKLFLGEGL